MNPTTPDPRLMEIAERYATDWFQDAIDAGEPPEEYHQLIKVLMLALTAAVEPLDGELKEYALLQKTIHESIASFLPADYNIMERGTLDAVNCCFLEIKRLNRK